MWPLKRKGGSAVAERPRAPYDFQGSDDELFAEIERLTADNRASRDLDTERRLLQLRHLAGIRQMEAGGGAEFPEPDRSSLREADTLPEFTRDELTPELLRAGILRDGCVLVRGLVDRDAALRFADGIDRSFEEREKLLAGEPIDAGYYDELQLAEGFVDVSRPWIREGGGVLAIDSPMLAFEMFELFHSAGIPQLVDRYLGEPGLISAHKTTLRKAEPSVPGAWHQDGAFMGPVRALNLWLSLSRCGDEAPGLDIVPKRIEELVTTQTDEALLSYQISQSKAEAAAGDTPIVRPIFEPGDALFFDEVFLHQTGSDPSMPKPRYAIENWFFGRSAFPAEYAPLAV